MLDTFTKMFGDTLGLSGDLWFIILLIVVVAAFVVSLVAGLMTGRFAKVKSQMRAAVAKPDEAVKAIQKMPASVKVQYKNARMGNLKPSMLVTERLCVTDPYKSSLISKVWLVTLVATLICGLLAFLVVPLAPVAAEGEEAAEAAIEDALMSGMGANAAGATILLFGGLLTLAGGIVGMVMHKGATGLYEKFARVMDGEQPHAQQPQQFAAPQYEQQPVQEPVAEAYSAEPIAAEPADEPAANEYVAQNAYDEPTTQYEQPAQPSFAAEPQESEEELRRRAREEARARMIAEQQAAQQRAQAATPPPQAEPVQSASGEASVDVVISRIEMIERQGATREVMRDVANQLQRERAKPENKNPATQKRLNDALGKLLKAMSAAQKK